MTKMTVREHRDPNGETNTQSAVDVFMAVTRGWQQKGTSHAKMDAALHQAIVQEVLPLLTQARSRISKLEAALIWCSGSSDLAPGGKAHKGWIKLCRPLLKKDLEKGIFIEIGLG